MPSPHFFHMPYPELFPLLGNYFQAEAAEKIRFTPQRRQRGLSGIGAAFSQPLRAAQAGNSSMNSPPSACRISAWVRWRMMGMPGMYWLLMQTRERAPWPGSLRT